MINELTVSNFWDTVRDNSDYLHIVFAYGQGCGPCANTKPKYEMVANYFGKMNAKIHFHNINVWAEENRPVGHELGVKVVPSFFGFFNGNNLWMTSGALDSAAQKNAIMSVIDNIYTNFGVKI
jgi:hypothetical protein